MVKASIFIICLCTVGMTVCVTLENLFTKPYHNYGVMTKILKGINDTLPHLVKLYSIGKSVRGRELWVLAIGYNMSGNMELRPSVKYIGNMHGNEVVNREMLLMLSTHLIDQYQSNSTIQKFLNTTVVHIMPSMNPDGYAKALKGDCHGVIGRYNAAGIDLNRNFPDLWFNKSEKPIAKETRAVMDWLPQHNFVLSANLHGGAMVANYPFDTYKTEYRHSGSSVSPDDDTFRFLALTYSRSHANMAINQGRECLGDYFPDGISNGAAWYDMHGGMQDYNYLKHGIFELTLEISCCKYPNASEIEYYWIENRWALINLLMEVHRGVKGIVYDEDGNPVEGVELAIKGRESVPFRSRNRGEYYRILMPGTYTILVKYEGYASVSETFKVVNGEVTRLDIFLKRETSEASKTVSIYNIPLIVPLLFSIMRVF
ncbi:carboxypeptidase D-like [Ruditapes philippinarum]|uniref:carboxypeptidase D-like n=1 Tax=Ruditapes philippinarum TaxID=129788 RepID=UPI00295BE08F|nr:carboxypeptidase D-like [Ruditapes philippinarum]